MVKCFTARWVILLLALSIYLLLVLSVGALATPKKSEAGKAAKINRGAITGQTQAKGYYHPNQYMHVKPVKIADNMERVIQHRDQDKSAIVKLSTLEKRVGKNPDGSLDLYLQNESPGKDKESHWLPAARDDFNLILRMYWPKPAVLQGVGKPPAVQAGK